MKTFVSTLMAILLWGTFPSSAMAAGQAAACTPAFPGAFECQVTVDQGWDSEQQQAFWFIGQGSNIIPYSWFLNLEQANSARLFRDPANIDSYGYLPQDKQGPDSLNPDGLPVGFTKDDTLAGGQYERISGKWLGLTCAACHTGQLEYGGRKVLIDGAPAMADFQSFFEDLATALRATYNSDEKFKRFAAAVTGYNADGNTGDATGEGMLREQLDTVTVILETRHVRNSGSIRFGNSRLDALGSILNQVRLAAGRDIAEGKVDAPVSYPFIWDTPQHDIVQWNGSVRNAGAGAPARNIGEVIGVFGALQPQYYKINNTTVPDHRSSVNIAQLGKLEELLWGLQSPKWEDVWKDDDALKIDTSLADAGERIYASRCKGCHALPIGRNDREAEIEATMVPVDYIGTDAGTAANFEARPEGRGLLGAGVAGVLIHELQKDRLAALKTIKAGQKIAVRQIIDALAKKHLKGDEEGFSDEKRLMSAVFLGELEATIAAREGKKRETRDREKQRWMQALKERNPKSWEKLTSLQEKEKCSNPLRCYKARPLNGVWASAPYLHNGSVRTLRQLLAPSERQVVFNVGSREYDPGDMGFEDAGNFVMDTRLPGNFNTGHDFYGSYFEVYKASLRSLMEYLKTL